MYIKDIFRVKTTQNTLRHPIVSSNSPSMQGYWWQWLLTSHCDVTKTYFRGVLMGVSFIGQTCNRWKISFEEETNLGICLLNASNPWSTVHFQRSLKLQRWQFIRNLAWNILFEQLFNWPWLNCVGCYSRYSFSLFYSVMIQPTFVFSFWSYWSDYQYQEIWRIIKILLFVMLTSVTLRAYRSCNWGWNTGGQCFRFQ